MENSNIPLPYEPASQEARNDERSKRPKDIISWSDSGNTKPERSDLWMTLVCPLIIISQSEIFGWLN